MDTFLKVAYATYLMKPRYIFVDSINAPFRAEAFRENSLMKQSLITGLLLESTSIYKGKLFAAAQVRTSDSGDIEASGFKIVDYYFDSIIGVFISENGNRYLKMTKKPIEVKKAERIFFRITENGVEWLD